MFQTFWDWYNRHERLHRGVASGLFLLQLVHLFWLTTHVVWFRLFGESSFNPSDFWQTIIILVDYTEIPALILTSIVYINELRNGFNKKSLFYLILLNTQWLHLFWITDEVVVEQFTGTALIVLPVWLSWIGILIDYLELPVMYDTFKKFFLSLFSQKEDTKSSSL